MLLYKEAACDLVIKWSSSDTHESYIFSIVFAKVVYGEINGISVHATMQNQPLLI